MVEMPNIPHDNVYKFVAFAGLVIVVVANVLFFTFERDLDRLVVEIEAAHSGSQAASERFSMHAAYVRSLIQRARSDKSISQEMLNDEISELLKEHEQRGVDQTAMQRKLGDYRNQVADRSVYLNVVAIATPVGILLSIAGCILWYRRVQVFQDKILAGQAAMEHRRWPRRI
jgi:hypothetical protein